MTVMTGRMIAGLLVAAMVGSTSACGGPGELEQARETCKTRIADALPGTDDSQAEHAAEYFTLGSDGKSLVVETPEPVDDAAAVVTLVAAGCVVNELKGPSSVLPKMGETRALDGRQEDSWGDYGVSWSYHPDAGFNAIFESK